MKGAMAGGEGNQIDDGAAIHYAAVQPGTPVYSADGVEVGTVREMLDNAREHIFDGVIFRDSGGTVRFADAPEVARTAERGVTLVLDAEQAKRLDPPESVSGPTGAGPKNPLGRLFGRGKR